MQADRRTDKHFQAHMIATQEKKFNKNNDLYFVIHNTSSTVDYPIITIIYSGTPNYTNTSENYKRAHPELRR